jgi:predicted DNA-binding transcriptional regulator YafY
MKKLFEFEAYVETEESRGDALYRRTASERIAKISALLSANKYPNCVGMAKLFEVSVRTIKRDIEFMKYKQALPIEYDAKRWGFYYSKPVENLPKSPMTEAEIFSVLVAHKAIAQYHGTPFEKPLRMAFQKLTGQLDAHELYTLENLGDALSFRPFAPEDADLRVFHVLTRALHEKLVISFQYRNCGARSVRRRRVQPYHLSCFENHWYLFAFDVERRDMRTFAISRLSKPELTKKRFVRPKGFNPDKYLEGSFGVMRGEDDYEVVIEFDSFGTDLVRGRRWHASQEFTELPGGGSQLRMRLSGLDEIERAVLNWGTHATVVRPAALAERVRTAAAEISARYMAA